MVAVWEMVGNGQTNHHHTGKTTDTRPSLRRKPLKIQRFYTVAKVALRLCLPAQRAPWRVASFRHMKDSDAPALRRASEFSQRENCHQPMHNHAFDVTTRLSALRFRDYSVEDFTMRAGECEHMHLRGGFPDSGTLWERAFANFRFKGFQRDTVAGDGMFDGLQRRNFGSGQPEFSFKDFFHTGLAAVGFHIGEFPEMGVDDASGALSHEEFSIAFDDEGHEVARSGLLAFAEVRQFIGAAFAKGDAEFFHRADQALRIARGANERAEFHEGLV
jgi:hypothetical protein